MLLMGLIIVCVSVAAMLRSSVKYGGRNYLRAPSLCARMEELFLPYEGRKPDEDELFNLSRKAQRLFEEVLNGLGLEAGEWSVHVHVDELLGAVPQLHGPGGEVLGVAAFETKLLEGTVDLPGA